MIKASELRLGNLLNLHGSVVEVIKIYENSVEVHSKEFQFWDESLDEGNIFHWNIEEEWLFKFGFSYHQSRKSYDGPLPYPFVIAFNQANNGKWALTTINRDFNFVKCINTIHELQNICFALIGEELTIKNG